MALDDYIRSPLGLLNVFAIILNVAAILGCGLQWNDGVSLQIVFTEHVWLSAAQFLLFAAMVIMITVLILYSFPRNEGQIRLAGQGLVFFLCVALVFELGSILIIIYYIMVDDRNSSFYMRYIFILIMSVLFLACVIIMIVVAHKYLNRIWTTEQGSIEPTHRKITVTAHHMERGEVHRMPQ